MMIRSFNRGTSIVERSPLAFPSHVRRREISSAGYQEARKISPPFITSLTEWTARHRFHFGVMGAVTGGGESGGPASRHFTDPVERYATGRLRPVHFWPDELSGHVERLYRSGD